MSLATFGYSILVLLALTWSVKTADNDIRIVLNANSATDGRIEVFHDVLWGPVCNDWFRMREANVACRQLGYESAVNLWSMTSPTNYMLDNVKCPLPEHFRLQDCNHEAFGTDNCNSNENIAVSCSGGVRELVSNLILRADLYWNCDYFVTGKSYNIKSGKNAVVYGTASFAKSPINSGFRLQGKSSWVNLGDFSDNECLNDPSTCSFVVSVWLRISKKNRNREYILGNRYDGTKPRGFSIYQQNHRLNGDVVGSGKTCWFWDFHFTEGYWFHFSLEWPPRHKSWLVFKDGHKNAKSNCGARNPQDPYIANPVYTLGADVSFTGNANQHLDVSFDELFFWYSPVSDEEKQASKKLASSIGGVSIIELTLKLHQIAWDAAYTDTSSERYIDLQNATESQLDELYRGYSYNSVKIKNLQNNGSVLQMSLQLNYSSVKWEHAYYLQKSFFDGTFLNSTAEILDCKSTYEFCTAPLIQSVTSHHTGHYIYVSFFPAADHISNPLFQGYYIRARQVGGSGSYQGFHASTSTNRQGANVKVIPYSNFSVTIMARSYKGYGFRCSNFVYGQTIEAKPGSSPSSITVEDLTPWNLTVVWGTIDSNANGVIQRYLVRLYNKTRGINMERVYVNASYERKVRLGGLLPNQQYDIRVCGYTSHPDCGPTRDTGWFYSGPLLPSKPPRDLRADNVGPYSVKFRWLTVVPSGRNGPMIHYEIHTRNLRTKAIVSYNYTITDENQESFEIWFVYLTGLTTYSVNISLLNSVGYGPIENLVFSTLEDVPSRAPENLNILNITADSIFLEWSALDIEHVNGILRGYHIYYRLAKFSDPWHNITSNKSTAIIPVLSLRTYEFKLCAFTAVGDGVFTPVVVTFVSGFAPFNLSTDVNVVNLTNDSMVVEWRYSTPLDRPAQYFIITATRNDTNKTEVREVVDVMRWTSQVYQYTIKNLKEFKWYRIHIAAGNIKGNASFNNDPAVNRTLEGVPSASPRNLTAINASSTSILLQWKPVLYEYADGIIRGYIVYWRLHTSIGTPWQVFQVNGSMTTSTVLQNLEKFKDYEFKVSAFNSIGESVKTNPVVARTDEDVPGHPPLNIIGHHTSSRSLDVSWQPPPDEWHFGIIRGYQVIIMDTRDGNTSVHDVPLTANNFEKGELGRYTNYSITVAASTSKGLGNFSKPIIVITDEDVPSEGPPNIMCTNTSSRSLSITWSVLPVNKAHGIVTSYKIFFERSDGRGDTSIDIQPSVSRNTALSGLDEYVEYTIKILATTIKGEGTRSDPVTCLTDQDIPRSSPQGLSGYNTSDTSIKVFWQEVPNDDQNGVILGYILFYNTTLRTGEIVNHRQSLDARMQDDLIGLLPFKNYSIRVAAFTSKGLGPTSQPVLVSTEEEAPKLPPGEVKAFNTSSTSIRLTWQAIPAENVGGILKGYVVLWEEVNYKGEVILQNQTRFKNASITSLDFNGLTKYQQYRFRILAFTKFDGVLSNLTVATMTDQDIPTAPPSNCSGFNISKNEIEVLWDVVTRPERNGIILGYTIYSNKTFSHFSLVSPDYVEPYQATVVNTTGSLSRSFVLDDLLPYTDYTFQVVAFTSKGEGPKCEHFMVRTEEEAPLYSPANLTLFNTSSSSLNVSWGGLSLSIIRGVFHGYGVFFTAYPQFPDAYLTYNGQEAKRKRRSVFTLDRQMVSVGSTEETAEITGLAKYTNYSIQVMGLTKFFGAQSFTVQLLTDEDKPSKTPRHFRGHNLTSTSLKLQWSPVQDGFVHGILLGYRIYYRVTKMPLMPLVNITYDPSTLESSLDDLLMFTDYTFQITAFTSKGEGPYTNEIVVCTDEDVASKSPLGFKVVTLFRTHEIPMSWHPVPNGFLNGILTGYRIKMRQISEGLDDVDGREVHLDFGPGTLSYTAKNLPNFATYTFQVVAVTKYGEGVHSPVRIAKTCPCEKKLTTNWTPLPPYTNKTDDDETGIFPWLIDNLVTDCCRNCYNGHGWSETLYKIDGKGADGFKYSISSFKSNIDDDTDFHFPIQGAALQDRYQTFYSYVFTIGSPGVAFFVVDDPPDKMPNAILDTVTGSWSLLLFAIIFSIAAGIVLWFLDTTTNEAEFPRIFYRGAGEGFWWAFISMTTVGYGDRSPRSIPARLFAMFWVLTGLVLTSILMSSITNALTTVTFDTKMIKLYGTKVAAIEGSPSYRVGIRRNALVNPDHEYRDAFQIQADLLKRNVKGALMDGYMAGSYHELFEDEHITVKEIIDYNSGYGIALGGQSFRLQKCFKNYLKRKRSYIINYVATQIKVVKKNPKSAAEAQSTNLFNPEAEIFVLSMTVVLGLYVAAIIAGLCFHVYLKRLRNKVEDASEAYDKRMTKEFSELLESFRTRISLLKEELYNKHTNELRVLSGIKRRPVKYDILAQLKEEGEIDYDSMTFPGTPIEISLESESKNGASESTTAEQSDEGSPVRSRLQSQLTASSTASLLSNSFDEIELRDTVESKPDIADLQRDAYLAGFRGPGSSELGHPYAKMYRYLWVEKGIDNGRC